MMNTFACIVIRFLICFPIDLAVYLSFIALWINLKSSEHYLDLKTYCKWHLFYLYLSLIYPMWIIIVTWLMKHDLNSLISGNVVFFWWFPSVHPIDPITLWFLRPAEKKRNQPSKLRIDFWILHGGLHWSVKRLEEVRNKVNE